MLNQTFMSTACPAFHAENQWDCPLIQMHKTSSPDIKMSMLAHKAPVSNQYPFTTK